MAVETLNDGGELYIAAAYFFEEMIKIQRIFCYKVVDDGHGIPFNTITVEYVDALHDLVE